MGGNKTVVIEFIVVMKRHLNVEKSDIKTKIYGNTGGQISETGHRFACPTPFKLLKGDTIKRFISLWIL